MRKMNLPKFTAEQSLYGKVVQPQLRKTDYECVHDCLEAGGGDICNFFCTENVDDGGGGGGGQTCRPGCGPCLPDPDSPMGGFRTCVKYDCDTYDSPCRIRSFPSKTGMESSLALLR
jgi:hypothetical protein